MTWIVTADGDELSMIDPRPGHITINTIAHSLAQINRFNGHAMRPYSVAEHSLFVYQIAKDHFGVTHPADLLAHLMHDAHEAFSGDMHSPGKGCIGDAWREWEGYWERHVFRAFGLSEVSYSLRNIIHHADMLALATERRDLVNPRATSPWACLEGFHPLALRIPTEALPWTHYRDMFLSVYHDLDFARVALEHA